MTGIQLPEPACGVLLCRPTGSCFCTTNIVTELPDVACIVLLCWINGICQCSDRKVRSSDRKPTPPPPVYIPTPIPKPWKYDYADRRTVNTIKDLSYWQTVLTMNHIELAFLYVQFLHVVFILAFARTSNSRHQQQRSTVNNDMTSSSDDDDIQPQPSEPLPCTWCSEMPPVSPYDCAGCGQMVGCKNCIREWFKRKDYIFTWLRPDYRTRELGRPGAGAHCPLCRHPWRAASPRIGLQPSIGYRQQNDAYNYGNNAMAVQQRPAVARLADLSEAQYELLMQTYGGVDNIPQSAIDAAMNADREHERANDVFRRMLLQ